MRDRHTTKKEKERLLHYFICSSLFDNFCDNNEQPSTDLYKISFFPESYSFTSFEEHAFIQSNTYLKNNILDPEQYKKACEALYNSQICSTTQSDCQITDEEIKDITRQKGGYSLMLCSFYLDEISSTLEQQCWYHIGEIIQLNDDLFDIYKDCNDKIATLANRMQDAYAFHHFFISSFKNIEKEIWQLPYPNKSKQYLINSLIGISAIGLVAIRHLQKIQRASQRLPDLKTLTHHELVIDMEKITNRLRCIKWYLKLQTSRKAV
ncbi:hypothetical protein [Arachidicoccus soli]|uniref:Uncharacterized protein n=1 Tax=Arachidicoccus soli TaxID=2341117 RepID=A0A386HQ99_9BACT|nr:hypothetical protein [Arachidicoccus soli]AYD47943.1 hypothetical protein D6B99_10280 [Arachidicoccus soli]